MLKHKSRSSLSLFRVFIVQGVPGEVSVFGDRIIDHITVGPILGFHAVCSALSSSFKRP